MERNGKEMDIKIEAPTIQDLIAINGSEHEKQYEHISIMSHQSI